MGYLKYVGVGVMAIGLILLIVGVINAPMWVVECLLGMVLFIGGIMVIYSAKSMESIKEEDE